MTLVVASQVALWVAMIVVMLAVLALGRQIGLLHTRLPALGAREGAGGPPIGELAPAFSTTDLLGRPLSVGGAKHRHTLLMFLSPDCAECADVLPSVKSAAKSEQAWVDVVLISLGSVSETELFLSQNRATSLSAIVAPELAATFAVTTTPFAVALDEAGIIRGKGLTNHMEHVESLINAMKSDRNEIPILETGSYQARSALSPDPPTNS